LGRLCPFLGNPLIAAADPRDLFFTPPHLLVG